MSASGAGTKRASPSAEGEKNNFEVEISDEIAKKLQDMAKDVMRIELANGTPISLPCLSSHSC